MSIQRVAVYTSLKSRDPDYLFAADSVCGLSSFNFCISAAYAVMWCLSVRPSVCVSLTFVYHVKTNKHIVEIFSPTGSHTILVFPTKRGGDIPTGTPLTGESNAGEVDRNRDSEPLALLLLLLLLLL